jgi:hypothetical protein
MVAVDTEDDSQGNVTIINFFDGESHSTFIGEHCRYKAWGHLHSIAPNIVWAVNAEYDLINIFGPWIGKLTTLQYVKAGLMRASYREAAITFLDTIRHWPVSVEGMGKIIGLAKLTMPHLGCICDDCVEYCRRDTEITWRYVYAMLERYNDLGLTSLRSTLPSMAFQLFRQFYPNEFPSIPEYIKNSMRKGYFGGRVEIYQTNEIDGPINHYDVNSLFPSVMLSESYPNVDSLYVTEKPDFAKEGIFEGWINLPSSDFPCLPVRSSEILFPYGSLYGSWPYPEVRQALNDGAEILSCKQAIEFDEVENPFDGYVKFCYQKRLESINVIDSQFYKLLLNSLYGKFGSHNEITVIYNDEEKSLSGESKQANIIWSAYVTSYARLKLLGYLRSASKNYYTDTDSLFTPDKLPTSSEIGALKLEGIYSKAWFKGNKIYCVDGVAKSKGVPKNKAMEFFSIGRTIYRKPSRLRESRRRGIQANIWSDVAKEFLKSYTKRKIESNGITSPWEISEYHRFMKRNNYE